MKVWGGEDIGQGISTVSILKLFQNTDITTATIKITTHNCHWTVRGCYSLITLINLKQLQPKEKELDL